MEVREIKALITLMHEHGLTELEIEDKRGKIRLVRSDELGGAGNDKHVARTGGGSRGAKAASAASAERVQTEAVTGGADQPLQLAPNQKLVESPMVGTFYRSPSPGAPPFAEDGASVHKGQTLCIIEAMKMMNEIVAPVTGKIVRTLCANSQPVQYGQGLMIIEVD